MLKIQEIKSIAKKVIKATSKILNDVEVLIVDQNGDYMALDETYIERKGTREWKPYINEIIHRKEVIVIDNPGYNALCKGCKNEGHCPQTLEITVPFNVDNIFIGYMSVITFTQEMKKEYLDKKEQTIDYMKIMIDLMVSAGQEHISNKRSYEMFQELNTIIQYMDYMVITCDYKGYIKCTNCVFCEFLGEKNGVEGKLITDLLESKTISYIIDNNQELEERESTIIMKDKLYRMAISGKVLKNEFEITTGYIFFIRNIEDIRQLVYNNSNIEADNTLNLIVGQSKEIKALKEKIRCFATSNSTILITGETGTGKELVARSIHSLSSRKDKAFVSVNCTAIPDNLLESELFGFEDGAFTGARKGGKPGLFEVANGGSVFLDEIGDMPIHLQAKLLRVLQEKQVTRIGGYIPINLDIRVISATNQNLEILIKENKFRLDLYYRLNIIPVNVPSLRDRLTDLDELIFYFIDKYNSRLNRNISGFDESFREALMQYTWPGNVRELENAIEYAINIETNMYLTTKSLTTKIAEYNTAYKEGAKTLKKQLEKYEMEIIKETIKQKKNEKNGLMKVAKALDMSKASLYQKIKKYNIPYKN